ncbi:hypothetical protein LTR28_002129, partial [Elasticomyces elasticus]
MRTEERYLLFHPILRQHKIVDLSSDKDSECATRRVKDFYTRQQQKAKYDSLLQKLKDNAIYLHTLCQQV